MVTASLPTGMVTRPGSTPSGDAVPLVLHGRNDVSMSTVAELTTAVGNSAADKSTPQLEAPDPVKQGSTAGYQQQTRAEELVGAGSDFPFFDVEATSETAGLDAKRRLSEAPSPSPPPPSPPLPPSHLLGTTFIVHDDGKRQMAKEEEVGAGAGVGGLQHLELTPHSAELVPVGLVEAEHASNGPWITPTAEVDYNKRFDFNNSGGEPRVQEVS